MKKSIISKDAREQPRAICAAKNGFLFTQTLAQRDKVVAHFCAKTGKITHYFLSAQKTKNEPPLLSHLAISQERKQHNELRVFSASKLVLGPTGHCFLWGSDLVREYLLKIDLKTESVNNTSFRSLQNIDSMESIYFSPNNQWVVVLGVDRLVLIEQETEGGITVSHAHWLDYVSDYYQTAGFLNSESFYVSLMTLDRSSDYSEYQYNPGLLLYRIDQDKQLCFEGDLKTKSYVLAAQSIDNDLICLEYQDEERDAYFNDFPDKVSFCTYELQSRRCVHKHTLNKMLKVLRTIQLDAETVYALAWLYPDYSGDYDRSYILEKGKRALVIYTVDFVEKKLTELWRAQDSLSQSIYIDECCSFDFNKNYLIIDVGDELYCFDLLPDVA